MSDDIITQIDKGLQRYYNQYNTNYVNEDGINKFIAFCEDNGFFDEDVQEELKMDSGECMIVDFDEDFPFPKDKKPKSDEAKQQAIFEIIMRCYKFENAYSGQPQIKILKEYFHFDNKQMIEITKKYEKYCDAIFLKANAGGDQALHKILDISDNIKKTGQPYLRLLADLYARDRNRYNFLIPKIRDELNDEISKLLPKDQDNITVNQLTHQTWAELNTHTKKIKNWNTQHKEFDLLLSALYSFYFRVCNLRDLKCSYKIDDNYMTICRYISAVVDFVYNIVQNQSICPFQYDFCIAFNNVKCREIKVNADQKEEKKDDNDDDDSDDDDDDDDDDDMDDSKAIPPQHLIWNENEDLYEVVKEFTQWAEKKKIREGNWVEIWIKNIIKEDENNNKKVKRNYDNIKSFEQLIQYLGGYFDCFVNIKQRLKDENMYFNAETIADDEKLTSRFKAQYDTLCREIKKKLPKDEENRKKELDDKRLKFEPKKQKYFEILKPKYDLVYDDKLLKKKQKEYKESNDKKLGKLLHIVDKYKEEKKQFEKYTNELAAADAKLKEEEAKLKDEKSDNNKKEIKNAIANATKRCETLKKKLDPYKKKFDEGEYGKEMKEYVFVRKLLYEIKELEIQKCNPKEINQYPQRFRFISVLDRREENKENETIENDELIFCEAHRNSFKLPPEEMKCNDLWYFHSSKKCIIPKCKNYDEDDKDKKKNLQTKMINTDHAMNHGMLLFSFHVDAIDEIRCYLYYGSQMVRFLPEDLELYLPLFFDEPDIHLEENKKDLNRFITNIKSKLVDEKFKAFYTEYKGKDEAMKSDIRQKMEGIISSKKKDKRDWIKDNYERIQKYSDLYARDLIDYYDKNKQQLSLEKWALVMLKDEPQALVKEVNNFYAKCKLLKPGIQNIKINYDYKLIYRHIYQAINFVYKLAKDDNRPCPFQYDCCFVFDTENDCFGDIKNRLNKAKLIYESETIKNSGHFEKLYGKLKDKKSSSFEKLYYKFVEKVKKKEPHDKQYPRRHRFLSVFDGRKRNKNENELIFFGSSKKTKSYKIGHTDNKCEGEWYFEQTCIIPNDEKENDNNESKTNEINICNSLINNGMLVLSFHVEGHNINRCYLYLGGKMVKILPTDLNTFVPELFMKNTTDKKDVKQLIKDMSDDKDTGDNKLYHKKSSDFAKFNNYASKIKEKNKTES